MVQQNGFEKIEKPNGDYKNMEVQKQNLSMYFLIFEIKYPSNGRNIFVDII